VFGGESAAPPVRMKTQVAQSFHRQPKLLSISALDVKARRGSWQVTPATARSRESSQSEKSRRPSAIFFAVSGFSSGTGR